MAMVSNNSHQQQWVPSMSNNHGQLLGDPPLLGLLNPPITPWPSPMSLPSPMSPPPLGQHIHTPQLPSLSPPIALGPSPMGHPIPNEPSPTGPARNPRLPSLGPPITP
ncbi:hypothetical protein PAXRUDRAFT_21550 [Paxillus rubicundulus Ve08.2h10]|uniref:Uncharacterized protein n=1 Tax=Paxillus rubicundulus Ve08.2h10 TaxID=930991 RepID=A0A0D0CPS6_9AGAM|nr:hypothetical protein PAXRUDRAFT_21550 [Paxillus rubicundulus Ve08.2h10]